MIPKTKKAVAQNKKKRPGRPKKKTSPSVTPVYQFILYVAGSSPKSCLAVQNLRQLCERHLSPDRYKVEIVDLLVEPKRAKLDQILAIPTLVKKIPPPFKKIIGDLSNHERVLLGLDIYDERGHMIFSTSQ